MVHNLERTDLKPAAANEVPGPKPASAKVYRIDDCTEKQDKKTATRITAPELELLMVGKVRRLKERLPGLAIVASHDFAANDAVSRAMG